jgi:hypothetical protein
MQISVAGEGNHVLVWHGRYPLHLFIIGQEGLARPAIAGQQLSIDQFVGNYMAYMYGYATPP